MNEIASRGQLHLSLLRWVMVVVPTIEFLGFVSSMIAGSSAENPWYLLLAKPEFVPPGWVFGLAWPILYVLIGVALAIILNARGAAGRGLAITVFLVQLVCNFIWSPLFFAAHEVTLSVYLILVILGLSLIATVLFFRIRRWAGLLMVPYLCWLGFATLLAHEIQQRNPDAERLVPPAVHTRI